LTLLRESTLLRLQQLTLYDRFPIFESYLMFDGVGSRC